MKSTILDVGVVLFLMLVLGIQFTLLGSSKLQSLPVALPDPGRAMDSLVFDFKK